MDALLAYAQDVFEFPDGKFTITPAKKKSKDDMEEEALLIDSDDQLQHYLSALPVDSKQAVHFRFAVVLGESNSTWDLRWCYRSA